MIRQATEADLQEIFALYERARAFMAANGNADQWGRTYPSEEITREDLARGELYVDCGADGALDCVFMFMQRPDESYAVLVDGSWLSEASDYGTIHRVAASGRRKGAASDCIEWCFARSGGNLRGDTHRDNHIMQHVFEKNGLKRCGIINKGTDMERIAYQRIL